MQKKTPGSGTAGRKTPGRRGIAPGCHETGDLAAGLLALVALSASGLT